MRPFKTRKIVGGVEAHSEDLGLATAVAGNQIYLTVQLPAQTVHVAVQGDSTPWDLKEQRWIIPADNFKLFVDGRELDDSKPLAGEPNNVTDGDTVVPIINDNVWPRRSDVWLGLFVFDMSVL